MVRKRYRVAILRTGPSTIHRIGGTVLGALLGVVLVITVTGVWGLVFTLFVLAVVAISLIRVNYGLAVVFITPLVLVLLNIPHPGQWEIADPRVLNALLGAAIGLLATTAILPGSERALLVDRSQIALERTRHSCVRSVTTALSSGWPPGVRHAPRPTTW